MPRGVRKEHLPSKVCVMCNRPFNWRKKWERCWDEVTTCSKSCNRKRRQQKQVLNAKPIGIEETNDSSEESGNDIKLKGIEETYSKGEEFLLEVDSSSQLLNELMLDDNGSQNSYGSDDYSTVTEEMIDDSVALKKAQKKAEKKRKKQERRAQREGRGDPSVGQKSCDMCGARVDLLIRCTYDESLQWKMVCGKCWKVASGGVIDGDNAHPYYRYGGLWKNRRRK